MKFRLLLLSGLILGSLLTGLAAQRGEIILMAIPLIIYLAAAWLTAPEPLNLEAKRRLSIDRAQPGGEVSVITEIINHGERLEEIYLQDGTPKKIEVLSGERSLFCSLLPGARVTIQYRVRGERGFYRFPGVHATLSDSFGLFFKKSFIVAPSQLFVLPHVQKLRKIEIRPRHTRIYSGVIPARIGGPAVEFHGLRPYQPGDPLRWISSRASAKSDEALYINQFEQERVADIGLIVDARELSNMPTADGSLLENSIDAAATLANTLLESGNRVGLLVYGGPIQWTFPRYGKLQKERIMQALAKTDLGTNPVFEDLDYIPTRLFAPHTQLFIMSPLIEEDLPVLLRLRARGYSLVIVSPDPIEFERRQLAADTHLEIAVRIARLKRDFLLKQLRQAGVQIVDWNPAEPFHLVAHQALSRPPLQTRVSGVKPR